MGAQIPVGGRANVGRRSRSGFSKPAAITNSARDGLLGYYKISYTAAAIRCRSASRAIEKIVVLHGVGGRHGRARFMHGKWNGIPHVGQRSIRQDSDGSGNSAKGNNVWWISLSSTIRLKLWRKRVACACTGFFVQRCRVEARSFCRLKDLRCDIC